MSESQISAREFWNLPEVKKLQDRQKNSFFGSEEHRQAFNDMKALCAKLKGEDFAETYFGDYE